jgi:hypothetical protein
MNQAAPRSRLLYESGAAIDTAACPATYLLFSKRKCEEVFQAALERAFKLLTIGSAAGLLLRLVASGVLALIVYQARRALSVDP